MSSKQQDFKPVKVKIKSGKQKSMKYISGDLLYSGVNLFGKLSEIYLEKIKNGEMFAGFTSSDFSQKSDSTTQQQDYNTPSMIKKSSTASASSTASVQPSSMLQNSQVFQMSQEVMSLFRKLQKKDSITKVKALKTLNSYIQKLGEDLIEGQDYAEEGSELSQLLIFFLYHFERIITYEVEKGVREATHDVLGEFLKICKKNFAKHIINLFPLWYISFYDTAAEIRSKARQNFYNTFKTPEIRSILFRKSVENKGSLQIDSGITISQNFLYFIQEKINYFDMLLSEDMTTLDKPQREAIFDRIISGCLDSLSDSFDTFARCREGQKPNSWKDEDTDEYISQVIDVLGLDTDDYPHIYKFMAEKYDRSIRASSFKLLERMSDYMISFNSDNKKIFEKHIHKLSNSMFSAIADQSSQVQKQIWKSALFNFCNKFTDVIWSQIDIKKGILPQLHTCLKNTGFGAHIDLYKNFVSFASIFPIFVLHEPFETVCKVEASNTKKAPQEDEKLEEEKGEEVENEDTTSKKKKKNKKQGNEGGGDKTIKNSFSISEKLNVMFEIMKSLFSGINVEEAIAFSDEIIDSYYVTMSFLYLKRIVPAIDHLKQANDDKNLTALIKKSTQCFMLPITEYLKNNDPKLFKSLYSSIPDKFSSTIAFLADNGWEISYLDALFADIKETLIIGLERSPLNAIKILSTFLITIKPESKFYLKVQQICNEIVQHLYSILNTGVDNLNKDNIELFEKNVEVFSYIAHNLLTSQLSSSIFDITEEEKKDGSIQPCEFQVLTKVLKMVKLASKKLKPEFLKVLEMIEEKIWLCLVLRMNYLLMRGYNDVKDFMDNTMLDFIFEDIKKYDIGDDRYLHFVIQYVSPADWLALLVSENIEKKRNLRKFKTQVLDKRSQEMDLVFIPYENYMRNSQKVQDQCLKILFVDIIDDYSKSHQIVTIYTIFKRKIEDYVEYKTNSDHHTILADDTVQSFLESTLEFLEEDEQVHKSFQLSELCSMLSKFILTVDKTNSLFEISNNIWKAVFRVLLDIQQNLASSLGVWKFIANVILNDNHNQNNEFLYAVENTLKGRISKLIELSNYQEHKFNKEIVVIRNYINVVPKEKVSLVESISRILLHEANFSLLSKNCLILKIFQQTFLSGGLGFNIDDLALQRDKDNKFKYIWLIGELLNAESLPSLAGYTNLRNQIKIFCETEVLPLILRECCTDSEETLFSSLIVYLSEKSVEKSSLYAKTLGNIVDLIVTPPEGLYELVADFSRWKELLEITIMPNIEIVIKTDDSNDAQIRRRIEMIKVISNSVKRLLYSTESYQDIIAQIIQNLDLSKESNIILFTTMIDENKIEQFGQISENEKFIRQTEANILKHISEFVDQKVNTAAGLDSILESLNLSIKRYGLAKIIEEYKINNENIAVFLTNSLDYLILQESKGDEDKKEEEKGEEISPHSQNAILLNTIGINLLQFIKRTISSLHRDQNSDTTSIISLIFTYSKLKAVSFNSKMDLLKQKIKSPSAPILNDATIQELEYELIVCIGDVISNLTPYIHPTLDEDTLYTLLSTHIETIQKSTYLALSHFYQAYIPPLKYAATEIEELTEEQLREQVEHDLNLDEDEEQKEEAPVDKIKGELDSNVSHVMMQIFDSIRDYTKNALQHAHADDEHKEDAWDDSEDEVLDEGYMKIQGASTLLEDKIMQPEIYSYLLAWNAMLNKIYCAKMKLKFDQDHEYLRVINSLQEFLEMNEYVYQMFLVIIVEFLPTKAINKWNKRNIIDCKPEWVDLNDEYKIEEFALFSMYNFMTNFPSLARKYYRDCDRRIYEVVHPIISKLISPAIMENEIRKIEISQADLNAQNLSFTLFKSTQEILADYISGEVEVQLQLKIPNEYPLRSVEVKCTKQLKIPEKKLKRWMLSIKRMISSQNGDFISAILLWKRNIEKEIEGVEDCLICYSTVHVIDKSLPKLACKNCQNKFHAHCIKKWFAESQKSKCPMCQSFFW